MQGEDRKGEGLEEDILIIVVEYTLPSGSARSYRLRALLIAHEHQIIFQIWLATMLASSSPSKHPSPENEYDSQDQFTILQQYVSD